MGELQGLTMHDPILDHPSDNSRSMAIKTDLGTIRIHITCEIEHHRPPDDQAIFQFTDSLEGSAAPLIADQLQQQIDQFFSDNNGHRRLGD